MQYDYDLKLTMLEIRFDTFLVNFDIGSTWKLTFK